MSAAGNHDPVNALAEAQATGRTAEIFADIRAVMQIPLVTSIWRVLAGVEGGLEPAWSAVKPIYESGFPDAILARLKTQALFPVPQNPPVGSLERAGFEGEGRDAIMAIFDAYNRSNGLNLIALTALVREPLEERGFVGGCVNEIKWPELRSLPERSGISGANWRMLERIKDVGAHPDNPAMPTLWRHLIHWPALLERICEHYEPLHREGGITRSIDRVSRFVELESPKIPGAGISTANIPQEALTLIEEYVGEQPSVSRMVTLGHGVAEWLTARV